MEEITAPLRMCGVERFVRGIPARRRSRALGIQSSEGLVCGCRSRQCERAFDKAREMESYLRLCQRCGGMYGVERFMRRIPASRRLQVLEIQSGEGSAGGRKPDPRCEKVFDKQKRAIQRRGHRRPSAGVREAIAR